MIVGEREASCYAAGQGWLFALEHPVVLVYTCVQKEAAEDRLNV